MDKAYVMTQIEKEISTCTKCGLCKTATNPVPGEGYINAEIVFVGEAPGATEDATGRPFVGRAGKLLEALLNALKMERKDVWIGNIIKHRPPDNRDPLPDEISACEGFLTRQLEAIKPKLIITLGRFSMNYFHKDGKISRDHGTLIKIKDYYVYPVYHPAAALRNGNMFEALKKDFARIPALLKQINEENSKKLEKDIFNKANPSDAQLGLDI
jgi:uracil-DNA glycosylase